MAIKRSSNWGAEKGRRLLQELKKYKGFLSNELYGYLESILKLEFSALGNQISDKARGMLEKLCPGLYREAVIYNIYNRTVQLFEADADKLVLSSSTDWSKTEHVYVDEELFDLPEKNYNYYYHEYVDPKIGTIFKFEFKPGEPHIDMERFRSSFSTSAALVPSPHIGNIELHQYEVVEGNNMKVAEYYRREAEALRRKCGLNRPASPVKKSRSSLDEEDCYGGICNSDDLERSAHRMELLRAYEDRINELLSKDGLNDYEKTMIELAQKYHELLCAEFGFTSEDFKPGVTEIESQTLLVKRPNFNIRDITQYLE